MHIHILGICGTFMGGVAALAKASGHQVTGQDEAVYPPMSTQLESLGIELIEGFDPAVLSSLQPDIVVIGNAMSRGNLMVEAVLNAGVPYTSGPQWLAEHVLNNRHVFAVAGTHGKTTTSSMLAWVLEHAGLNPGFLIGGVPGNFAVSARLGQRYFVVEADEYDTAFFDKRSKFVHYHPRTLVLNNLEFDHADIFPDLAAIQRQFHHVIRTVPSEGRIVCNAEEINLAEVLELGCWTPVEYFGDRNNAQTDVVVDWQVRLAMPDGSAFDLLHDEQVYQVQWELLGRHNVMNGIAAIAAARHAGVSIERAAQALSKFEGVKRRCEVRGQVNGITVYDDFAHHPTAIETTLQGLRANVAKQRLIAVFEPRSNTMQMGVHQSTLAASFNNADQVWLLHGAELEWDLSSMAGNIAADTHIVQDVDELVRQLVEQVQSGDHVVIMSNGGFGGIHDKLLAALA